MNRGEVWTVAEAERRWRVVVLSGDAFNRLGRPYCAPVTRRPSGELPPYAVPLAEQDPVSGIALVGAMEPIRLTTGLEQVGYLTGPTLTALDTVLRDLFGL